MKPGPITAAELDAWIDALDSGHRRHWIFRNLDIERTRARLVVDMSLRVADLEAIEAAEAWKGTKP
jgi:hypothetical protein